MLLPKQILLAGGLFILFFSLYFYKLTAIPESFANDEVIFGYNAFSLLQTGRDEYGKVLPIISESNGDYKLLLLSYWLIPSVAIFGLNEFAVRFGHMLAALVILGLVFLLVKKISSNIKLSLLTVLLMGISPWFIVFSRSASEVMVSMLFFFLYLYFVLFWIEKEQNKWFFTAVILATISATGYYSVWSILVVSLFFISLKIIVGQESFIHKITQLLALTLPIAVIVIAVTVSGGARMRQINLLQNSDVQALLEEQIREDQQSLPIIFTRFYHNKLVFYPFFAARQLVRTFNPDFLFFSGDSGGTLYVVPDSGVLYLWYWPFLILGLFYFFCQWKTVWQKWVLPVVVAVIFSAGSLSVYGSPSQRTIMAAPFLCFFTAYGLLMIYQQLKQIKSHKILAIFVLLLISYPTSLFLHQYLLHADVHRPWFRNFGDKQMVAAVNRLKSDYKDIVVPQQLYSAIYFYNKVDPAVAQADSQHRQEVKNALGHFIRIKAAGIYLMPIDCPAAGKLDILYVCYGNNIPRHTRVVDQIKFRDGTPAYTLLEFSQKPLAIPPEGLHFWEKSRVLNDEDPQMWLSVTEITE